MAGPTVRPHVWLADIRSGALIAATQLCSKQTFQFFKSIAGSPHLGEGASKGENDAMGRLARNAQ